MSPAGCCQNHWFGWGLIGPTRCCRRTSQGHRQEALGGAFGELSSIGHVKMAFFLLLIRLSTLRRDWVMGCIIVSLFGGAGGHVSCIAARVYESVTVTLTELAARRRTRGSTELNR